MFLRHGPSPVAASLLVVLVLAIAGITHVLSLMALPWRSPNDASVRIAAVTPPDGRTTLGGGAADLPFADPAMLTDVCRFDLAAKPFRLVLSPFADGFVTIGFHGRHGLAFYGLTVRASDASAFDLVLQRPGGDQAAAPAEADARKVVVMTPEPDGFVTLSTPLGDGSGREAAAERLSRFDCRSDVPAGS